MVLNLLFTSNAKIRILTYEYTAIENENVIPLPDVSSD